MKPSQRRAMFAKQNQPQHVKTPFSRKRDIGYAALGAYITGGANVLGRGVRRITERQYTSKERQARRGTAVERSIDHVQQILPFNAALIGNIASSKLIKRGNFKASTAVAGAGLGVSLAGWGVARKYVNKKRDARLVKAGGKVRRVNQ